MLLSALLLSFLHLAIADLGWWQTSILYQIYPRSFADSDGDGNGDLRGIISHVPYLKEIGVGIIWLSPILASPMKDNGYDISDYRSVNPMFGNVSDVEELINEVHKHGMKIFLDFVPNHSSDLHPWFNSSRYKVDGKDDFYVWSEPKSWNGNTPLPPNNWLSQFGGSAWTFDEVRKQFYLHQFGSFQPDLNYRNKELLLAMKENMKFWLDKGLDGFRVDACPFLVEDQQLRDEPQVVNCTSALDADCLQHIYTQNQPETYETLKLINDMLEQYDNTSRKYMYLEVYASLEQTVKYYMSHASAFNFELINKLKMETKAKELKAIVDNYMSYMNNTWPNWVLGNHDNPRIGTRMGPALIDAMNMMALMLPGASITYNGEEIGMTDMFLRKEEILDVSGRDPERTPMQWNRSKNAGFSNATKTWLPVNPDYYKVNVESEKNSASSHLSKYIRLAGAKKNFIQSKELQTTTFGDWVFGFKRTFNNAEYYVLINLNNFEEEVILNKGFASVPTSLYVHTPSDNSRFKTGDKVSANSKIVLQPKSAVAFSSASSIGQFFSALMVSIFWCFVKWKFTL